MDDSWRNFSRLRLVFASFLSAACVVYLFPSGATGAVQCPVSGIKWIRDSSNCSVNHWCVHGNVSLSFYCGESYIAGGDYSLCLPQPDEYDWSKCESLMKVNIKNDPRCVNKNGSNPEPSDCSRFVECWEGTSMSVKYCPKGLLYLERNRTCSWSTRVKCGSRSTPQGHNDTWNKYQAACNEARNRGHNHLVNPDDCTRYISCDSNNIQSSQQCPQGLVFNVEKQKCDYESSDSSCTANGANGKRRRRGLASIFNF